MLSKITLAAAASVATVQAGDTAFWKARTIYQVLTDRFARTDGSTQGCADLHNYCGGTFKGLENHLDYITGMGFDAIWISPVVDNLGEGYHGYWAKNWEKVNAHFGSEDDLKSLVNTAHSKGVAVMVDVVANHVAPIGEDFSQIYPLNRAEHYHSTCQIQNWSNQSEVENCRLADLPDLNQGNSYVRQYLKDWIKNLVSTYKFDGIRIDTIPEVPADFWSEYGQAAGVFQMGECFNGDTNYVAPYQQHLTALFNYPMYFTIKDVFGSGQSMYNIKNRFAEEDGKFKDVDALGIFVDNHDNARFQNYFHNDAAFKSALTFALTARGIPFFYYGSEQFYAGGNDPYNRETLWQDMDTNSEGYQYIKKINAARKAHQPWGKEQQEKWVAQNIYAYNRGDFFVALSNSPNDQQFQPAVFGAFKDGETVCNIFFPTTDCQQVQGGKINVYLAHGESKIYLPSTSSYFQSDAAKQEQVQQFL